MAEELEPGLLRVVAPNPSPMTAAGTNSYVVGTDVVAVIDPGPDDPAHGAALEAAVAGRETAAVLVTHAHLDHSAGARRMADALSAPVLGFGPPETGRSPVMQRLAADGLGGGGEGVHAGFRPDRLLLDGDVLQVGDERLGVLWTPGHFAGHLCFAWRGAVFTGDHVMAWASCLISPPDGDLRQYIRSCERLAARADRVYYPGHGPAVTDPAGRLHWLIAHRREREAQVLAALSEVPAAIPALTRRIYADVPPALHWAAARNLLAHLVDLYERGLVAADPALSDAATFRLA